MGMCSLRREESRGPVPYTHTGERAEVWSHTCLPALPKERFFTKGLQPVSVRDMWPKRTPPIRKREFENSNPPDTKYSQINECI